MKPETAYNRAYLATVLCTSAQIQPYGGTSDTLGTLSEISNSPSWRKGNLNHQKTGLASFNQETRGINMDQIATQPGITGVKRLRTANTQIFNNRSEGSSVKDEKTATTFKYICEYLSLNVIICHQRT